MKLISIFLGFFVFVSDAQAYLNVYPSSVNFGSVRLGRYARSLVRLENTGDQTLQINISHNCSFGIRVNAFYCAKDLEPNRTCSFDVEFNPRREGYNSCWIWVRTQNETKSISVSGRGSRY